MVRGNRLSSRFAASAALLFVLFAAGPVFAGGFEYGPQGLHAVGRGGAFVAKADDPSAIYWNPGKLSLLRGTRVMYNHNFTDSTISFEGQSEQESFFPLGASFALTTDFGLEDWTFGIGMQGPAAVGDQSFDYARDAPTRYGYLGSEVMIVHAHLAAAWKYEELFGLGVSLQYVAMPYLKYSLALDLGGFDMLADMDMSDWFSMNVTFGGWVRPLPYLEIGVSAKLIPIEFDADGNVVTSGTPGSAQAALPSTKAPAELTFSFPMTVQAGIRYFYEKGEREIFDIELDFVWEGWSVLDAYRVDFKESQLDAIVLLVEVEDLVLTRNYDDTYSVRLGGDWNMQFGSVGLTARLGGWWESGASPEQYSLWDFPSFQRFGVAGGLSVVWNGVEVGLSYAHVFQETRTVAEGTGAIPAQTVVPDPEVNGNVLADGAPANEGTIKSSYDIITIGVGIHFDELID